MKSLFIFLFILFIGTTFAQNVPAAAKNKLKALYPKAEKVKWDKEGTNFEANFEVNDTEMSVIFDAKGTVLETETEIEKDDLPAAVKNALKKDFAGYDVEETAKIEKNGKTTFEAQVKKGEIKLDAIYSPVGKLIKKIEKKEKDEESEKAEHSEKEENEENEHEK